MELRTDPIEYNIPEFFEKFGHALPKVVRVTQGYFGDILEDTFDSGMVIRLHTYVSQKRVVARYCKDGKTFYYSIPLDYPYNFSIVKKSNKAAEALPLETIVTRTTLPVQVKFDSGQSVAVGNQTISTKFLPVLELTTTFDEMYLLGNIVYENTIEEQVVGVPLYLSQLLVAQVVGFKDQPYNQWETYLHNLAEQVASRVTFDPQYGNKDIAVYNPDAIHPDSVYSHIEPTAYSNWSTIMQLKGTLRGAPAPVHAPEQAKRSGRLSFPIFWKKENTQQPSPARRPPPPPPPEPDIYEDTVLQNIPPKHLKHLPQPPGKEQKESEQRTRRKLPPPPPLDSDLYIDLNSEPDSPTQSLDDLPTETHVDLYEYDLFSERPPSVYEPWTRSPVLEPPAVSKVKSQQMYVNDGAEDEQSCMTEAGPQTPTVPLNAEKPDASASNDLLSAIKDKMKGLRKVGQKDQVSQPPPSQGALVAPSKRKGVQSSDSTLTVVDSVDYTNVHRHQGSEYANLSDLQSDHGVTGPGKPSATSAKASPDPVTVTSTLHSEKANTNTDGTALYENQSDLKSPKHVAKPSHLTKPKPLIPNKPKPVGNAAPVSKQLATHTESVTQPGNANDTAPSSGKTINPDPSSGNTNNPDPSSGKTINPEPSTGKVSNQERNTQPSEQCTPASGSLVAKLAAKLDEQFPKSSMRAKEVPQSRKDQPKQHTTDEAEASTDAVVTTDDLHTPLQTRAWPPPITPSKDETDPKSLSSGSRGFMQQRDSHAVFPQHPPPVDNKRSLTQEVAEPEVDDLYENEEFIDGKPSRKAVHTKTPTEKVQLTPTSVKAEKEIVYTNQIPRGTVSPTPHVKPEVPTAHAVQPEVTLDKSKPPEIETLTVDDLCEWMNVLHLEKYVPQFRDETVDGMTLLEYDNDILMEDFKMNRREAIRLMNFARKRHVPK